MPIHSRCASGAPMLALMLALCAGAPSSARAQNAPISNADRAAVHVMPLPASLRRTDGFLVVGRGLVASTEGCRDARVTRAVARLRRELDSLSAGTTTTNSGARLTLRCSSRSSATPKAREDESYSLTVTPDGATLSAASSIGVLRGLETVAQLVERDASGLRIPAMVVQDSPRYPWRGLMIDVSRHWMPKEVILRNLGAMAAVKLNVLHLHLSDDQGFRVESKVYPRLHEVGSGGHYYTQADVREIVAFAADRGIRIVPEFDLPGHSTSWLVAYPELGSAPGPYTLAREYGIHDATMDPTREETYRFLDRFFGEMATLFPDEYVHIGGDEVSAKTHWNTNPRIQQFVAQHGLKDRHGLQAYFNRRMQQVLARHGRKLAGWDEILSDSLDRSAVIQSWRGQSSLLEAVNAGFDAILSAGWYLDFKLPAADHYRVDPARASAVARIVPDSAHWKSWKLMLRAGPGSVESMLTLFGTPDHPSGALEFAGSASPASSAIVAGDSMRLRFESGQTPAVVTAVAHGDSLRGTIETYGFTLPLTGVRSGGSDMAGTTMPAFKTVAPLSAERSRHILGGEGAMWSENVSAGTVDSRLWPRAAAIAEKLWSPAALTQDVGDMYRRLDVVSSLLTQRGVTHESAYPGALRTLLGADDVAPLRTLVDVLEEVKYYQRMAYNPKQSLEPELTSLADVARPESRTAREFSRQVDAYLADRTDRAVADSLRAELVAWRDNDATLAPRLGAAKQADDIRALSAQLSGAAAAGLAALDALARGTPLAADELARHRTLLDAAAKARAAVVDQAIPAIRRLVEGAGRP